MPSALVIGASCGIGLGVTAELIAPAVGDGLNARS